MSQFFSIVWHDNQLSERVPWRESVSGRIETRIECVHEGRGMLEVSAVWV
jgi:hypothetical protein